MAMNLGQGGSSGGGRRRRSRGAPMAEINVTPLVDVMLVLLIIFMISAPLLTVGVEVELPKTEAGAMEDQSKPINISIRADGSLFVQEDAVAFNGLAPRLKAMAPEPSVHQLASACPLTALCQPTMPAIAPHRSSHCQVPSPQVTSATESPPALGGPWS